MAAPGGSNRGASLDLRAAGLQDGEAEERTAPQQICDAILQAKGSDLQREFPFARWSASATKPDWSSEQGGLWVELKYVRKRSDIHQITEAIAADITKYGDTGVHVLFVVYDPQHEIDSDERFAEPIQARPQFRVHFVR